MMMINSNSLENQLDKHHCHAKPSYDDINNNHQYELDNCDENTMKSDCLSLNDNNNHLHHQNQTTLLTTTTTTTTVEVKVKTTKTSSRKRKLNQMNNEQIVQTPTMTTNKKKNSRMTKIESNQANGKTADQSSSTDESAFGSCEPGTNVVLQGIVWNETDKGVLVVNITWRGKTYVGALLNTTEQNWAPPRYKPEIRSTKSISIREQQLTNLPSINESTERILRNGKRRGSSTTVTPNSTTKTRSFKIPETPKTDKLSSQDDDNLNLKTNALVDDDNSSSRSVSPTTSAISTMSSSPPLLISSSSHQDNLSTTTTTTIPIDLSNPTNSLVSYNFPDQILFPSSSYLPNSSQMYFNSLPSTH